MPVLHVDHVAAEVAVDRATQGSGAVRVEALQVKATVKASTAVHMKALQLKASVEVC
jgi:hypothetical protein